MPDQSGSRRAARRRSHLHAVRAGVDRQRRLADVGVADAGAQAVLRRHLFSAGQSLRPAGIPRDSRAASRGPGARIAREIEESGAQVLEQLRAVRRAVASSGRRHGRRRGARFARSTRFRRMFDSRAGRVRRRAEVSAAQRPQFPAALLRANRRTRKRSTWCC